MVVVVILVVVVIIFVLVLFAGNRMEIAVQLVYCKLLVGLRPSWAVCVHLNKTTIISLTFIVLAICLTFSLYASDF